MSSTFPSPPVVSDFRARFPHRLIRASAGTGKTYQLSNRYLALLRFGAPVDQILAVTFTRKAAGEILDRVVMRLAGAATDDAQRRELGRAIGDASLTRSRCLEMLGQTLRNLHRVNISTLDSFFSKLAGAVSLELGLPPGWRIIDELPDLRLRDEAIEAVLRQETAGDLLTLAHLLTKGETPRGVGELIRSTVADLYGIYLEAPPDAWQRVPRPKRLTAVELRAAIDTLRAVEFEGGKSMRRARDEDCQRAEVGNWDEFISKGVAKALVEGKEVFSRQPIPAELAAAYQPLIEEAKAKLVGDLANQTQAAYRLLEKFHVEYQRLKQERRAARFDDITRQLAEFAESDWAPTRGNRQLAHRLDGALSHLLLDEFQDTSLLQWQVLRPFAVRATRDWAPTGGNRSSFFCVGDTKQAIYGWRGGKAEIFDALEQELESLTSEMLAHSYRSAPPVIETVNRIFPSLPEHPNLDKQRKAIERWSERFPRHTTARTDLSGYVTMETSALAKDSRDQADVTFTCAAKRVAELVKQAPGRSVGVLVRRNSSVGKMIYLLRREGVAASEEGGNPLVDSAPVELIMSLLRLADHPGDTIARFHVASSPCGADLGLSAFDDQDAAVRLAQQTRRRLVEQGYGPTIYQWAQALAPHCNDRDLARLGQLIELAYEYDHSSTLRADDFLQHVEHTRVADPGVADVRVMTIHQCKGLEFDMVVLPEVTDRLLGQPPPFVVGRRTPAAPIERLCHYASEQVQALLPQVFRRMFRQRIAQETSEALCVLYVALTRAVHGLHIIAPPSPKNERTMPRTFLGLLRVALTDGKPLPPEQIVYHCGDPNWAEREARPPMPPQAAQPPLAIQLAPLTKGRSRGRDTASPSSLEGGDLVDLNYLFGADPLSMKRGELIHAFFEQIQWLDEGRPSVDELSQLARRLGTGDLDEDRLLEDFEAMLAQPEIAAALSRSRYPNVDRLEVYNERPFAVLDGQRVLRGYIDRLVLGYRNGELHFAEVLDFKTDSVPRDDDAALNEKADYYRPQIAAYCRAVAEMTGLPSGGVTGHLLFVASGVVRQVV